MNNCDKTTATCNNHKDNLKDVSQLEASRNNPNFHSERILDNGWILHLHNRDYINNNSSKVKHTHTDRYWFSPKTHKKIRSRVELEKFMNIMNDIGEDNEELAWERFKSSTTTTKVSPENKKQKRNTKTSTASKNDSSNVLTTNTKTPKKKTVRKGSKGNSNKSRKIDDDSSCDESENEYYTNLNNNRDENPTPIREFSFRQRKPRHNIDEAKQIMLTPEQRNEILFAEAVVTAVDEHQHRMKSLKHDPYSAFYFQKDLLCAEPKTNHCDEAPLSKGRRVKTSSLKEAKLSKQQNDSFVSENKLNAESKCDI